MTPWTEEKIVLLRQRWAEGISATKIAEEIGPEFSRNSVIGKARRLGLPRHAYKQPSRPRPPSKPKRSPMIRVKATAMVDVSVPIQAPPEDRQQWVPFMDLTSKHCRAILGQSYDDGLALFCPNPKDDTESYCPHHMGIYYNPRSSR